ncbi:MAG: hypothetical protein LBL90_08510 [Prevotellaceae bacterium]|jgi:hypothetical protein|nr:hypothetical protein [Prevotellaceae bacterium]
MKTILIVLSTLALLSTLIFLVLFVIRAVKKQNKKLPGIITLISFVILIIAATIGSQLYPVGHNEIEHMDVRKQFIEIDGCKIHLGDTEFNKNGFLEIKLNADRTSHHHCYSAFLTVEEGDTPIYIESERGDISAFNREYRLAFATNKTPENLYVELGEWGSKESRKWYHFDLKTKNCVLLEEGCPFESLSAFDNKKLINAANFIKSNIRTFKPANPQAMHFIVYAKPVINPLTRRVSTGGRTNTDRYLPISTQDVINDNGILKETGGLILTDNPDAASFVLILDFTYVDEGRKFHCSDYSTIKEYDAVNKFELYNLVSGESIKTEITTDATYVGEEVSVTYSSKGKQMFAGTIGTRFNYGYRSFVGKGLSATQFDGYVEFICK